MKKLFKIYTHLTKRERLLLFQLAKSLASGCTIVEVGSYLGASACFLAEGARLKGGKVYCVDTWTNTGMSEGPRDTYDEFIRNTELLRQWITPLRGLSTEVARQFNYPIDLLFVDGDHSYEAVRADLEAWLPLVKENGIVAFHDYSWAEGVRRAVRELVCPMQTEGGHKLDRTYWTHISPKQKEKSNPMVTASVIVPTYGRPAYLQDLLVSLQSQSLPAEQYEILVVDNEPSEEVCQVVKEINSRYSHQVRYIKQTKVGLLHARHAGAQRARGEILVYVDDDVIVHPFWLEALLKPYQDPQIASVGGKVVLKYESEPPQWLSQFDSLGYLSQLDLGEEPQELVSPTSLWGCNMSVRRSVLYEVGGFNPDAMGDRRLIWLRGDGEGGLYKKIYDADYKVVYEPRAGVFHRIPASRLKAEYFYWRAFIQGISDSYSQIRAISASRFLWVRLPYYITISLLEAIRCYVSSLWRADKRIRIKADAQFWWARAQHLLRVVLSPQLRRYVQQDTYLDGDLGSEEIV